MPNQKRIVINTRERAVSSDINRLQAFAADERMELARYWLGEPTLYEVPSSKNLITNSLVLNGLLVRPDPDTHVTIDPGAMITVDPSLAGADDNDVVMAVSKSGLTTTTLAFVPNVSGSTRIDVFECRPAAETPETSNRDIYDPATGLFSPSSINKVQQLGLEFRVRNGAPGLADDTDWLPLAVAFVKTTDTGYSTCDFFDVRPIISERDNLTKRSGLSRGLTFMNFNVVTVNRITGTARGVVKGFRVLSSEHVTQHQRTTPVSSGTEFGNTTGPDGGAAVNGIFWTADNLAAGLSPSNGDLVMLVAMFPALSSESLPRWQRYSQTASPREPVGPCGIYCFQPESVQLEDGSCTGAVLPSHMSMLDSSSGFGLIVGFAWFDNGGSPFYQTRSKGGWIHPPERDSGVMPEIEASAVQPLNVQWNDFSPWTNKIPAFCQGWDITANIALNDDVGGGTGYAAWSLFGNSNVAGRTPMVRRVAISIPAPTTGFRYFSISGVTHEKPVSIRAEIEGLRVAPTDPDPTLTNQLLTLNRIKYWPIE